MNVITSEGVAIFKSSYITHVENYSGMISYDAYPTFIPSKNGNFLNLVFRDNKPEDDNSFIGCIYRHASKRGLSIGIEERVGVAKSALGWPLNVIILRANSNKK